MKSFIRAFFFFCAPFVFPVFASVHVAVLETISASDALTGEEKMYLTDELRSQAVRALPAEYGFTIMTRENINAMLPPGKSVEDCAGNCLVETGKNIAAEYVAQGRVGKFGSDLTLTVELYETAGGKLIGSFTAKSADADGLLSNIQQQASSLFAKARGAGLGLLSVNSGISGVSGNSGYAAGGVRSYIVKISTEPAGAALSIDGKPVPKCRETPCSVQVTAGEHRFFVALDNYEGLDTLLTVNVNGQILNLPMITNYGILNVAPILPGNYGYEEDTLSVKIDGSAAKYGENKLAPGGHSVEISHPCYETVTFNAGLKKGGKESFSKALVPATGGLSLNAEDAKGEPQMVPVYVDGVQKGTTPFLGDVPLCATLEAGESREEVPVSLKFHETTEYTMRVGSPIETSADVSEVPESNSIPSGIDTSRPDTEESHVARYVAQGVLFVAGAVLGGYAYYSDQKASDLDNSYSSDSGWASAKDDADSYQTKRNIALGVGVACVGVGLVLFAF